MTYQQTVFTTTRGKKQGTTRGTNRGTNQGTTRGTNQGTNQGTTRDITALQALMTTATCIYWVLW